MNIQDWFPLGWTGLRGTLNSLLQQHNSKTFLWHSAFFMVQLSHPYMTTGKSIALTRRTFVSKVISLLFNMLSRVVIAFLPRSKRLLISWLQLPSTVILKPPKIKSVTVFLHSQLSYSYMTTGKTIALTRWTFVGKVMSLLFNMLSKLHNFPSKE